ncbi:PLP-dependent aminotransferase family protein [Piscinibacter sakaiensis]|uniref:MocR-like pyridoxine biosynthesis transcription factor PdxR n=1 Tax=Piscinibacter sakaiensis TaxID=1547922 RepID=UPI003AACD26A
MDPRSANAGHGPAAIADLVRRRFANQGGGFDHRRLYDILQSAIREAEIAPDSKLPPSRALAAALGIARNTVTHVYEQLTLEGFVHSRVGRGTFVAAVAPRLARRDLPPSAPEKRRATLSSRGGRLIGGLSAAPRQWGAFAPGVPEVRQFPVQTWNRLQARVWRGLQPAQMSYATGAGDALLRRVLAEYLQDTRGLHCSAEQIVITSGTQQSLHLIAHLLTDPGDAIWIEDPGYWGVRSVFRAMGLEMIPVPLDAEGLAPNTAHLRTPPRAMFVSPAHQYPTGVLMSHGRRRQLLDYAAVNGVWVIEDDYDSEFRYGSRPLPVLQGLDRHGRVIYLGTFSKTLFPALRVAYAVLPEDLVDSFASASRELYREGHSPQQAVLARFIFEGHFSSHVRRMRAVYGARHDALIASIQQHFGDQLPIIGGDAGLHLVLGLPAGVDDRLLSERIASAGIATRPLSNYQISARRSDRGLLLGYGAVDEQEIGPHFAKLAAIVGRYV